MDAIVVYDEPLAKFAKVVKYLQENPNSLLDSTSLGLMDKEFEESYDKLLDYAKKNTYQVPESPSVNLQDLEEITKVALDDYHRSMNPRLTSDLKELNNIRLNADNFFEERCKNYAEEIESIIDNMIIIEEYDYSLFRNYKELARFVSNSEGKKSAMYLRKLISVARFVLPTMSKYMETEVVDAGITSKSNMPDAK